jgi:hypothetical protein
MSFKPFFGAANPSLTKIAKSHIRLCLSSINDYQAHRQQQQRKHPFEFHRGIIHLITICLI